MISFFFLFSSIIFYYMISIRTKDYLHPLGVGIFLWFFAAGIANVNSLYDVGIQKNISLKTNFVVFFSGIFFIFPFLFSYKLNKAVFNEKKIYFGLHYKFFLNLLIILSLLNFLLRFNSVLFSPPFFNIDSVVDVKSIVPPALPIINLFDVLTPFLAALCLFELYFSYNLNRSRRILLIGFVLFSAMLSIFYKVSRGELVIVILAFIYFYSIPRNFKFSLKYFSIFSSLIFSFLYLGVSRISNESRVSTQFGDGFFNVVLSQLYTYIAMNFQNLNTLVNSNFAPTYFWGAGKFILYPFFKEDYENNLVGLTDFNTDFFNAKTYLYYFINDMGVFGAFLYSLIIGLIIQSVYNLSVRNIKFFVLIACLLKPIIFMFFGNYFFGDNILFLPYLFVFILILMMKTVSFNK